MGGTAVSVVGRGNAVKLRRHPPGGRKEGVQDPKVKMATPSEGIQMRPDMIQRASLATVQKLFLGSSIRPSAGLCRIIAKPMNKARAADRRYETPSDGVDEPGRGPRTPRFLSPRTARHRRRVGEVRTVRESLRRLTSTAGFVYLSGWLSLRLAM